MNETIKLLFVTGVLAVGGIGLLMYNNSEEKPDKNKKHKKYGGRKNKLEDEDESLSGSDDSLSDSDVSLSDSDDSLKNENDKDDNNWLDLRSYFGNAEAEHAPKYHEKSKSKSIKQKERNNKTKRKKQ